MLHPKELHLRAAFLFAVRKFFRDEKFLEVDTPLRQPVLLPENNIVPLPSGDHYLQTSPELCMKRVLAAGCENIFQICPCFRKEETGRNHLEEFTMLEWYRKGATYLHLMEDCEKLFLFVLEDLKNHCSHHTFSGKSVMGQLESFRAKLPWERLSVKDAFERFSPYSLEYVLREDIFDEILVEEVEPRLGKDSPVFLYDYPSEMASLARKKEASPQLAERFELYYRGLELANGFSELTDSSEQRHRFEEELNLIHGAARSTGGMPEKFLQDLDNIGEAAGIALGLDRLFMLILGKERIAEAVSFSPEDL